MSFSWDFLTAAVLVLALVSAFLFVLPSVAGDLKQDAFFSEKQRNAIFKADFLLKNCFPEGIAFCENGFLYSHVADGRASLGSPEKGLCVKRLVLQEGKEKTLVVCG
ncbi:MAG: hypothetical protein V1717_00430 [Candidatus Micrarchaeota archaeon]